MNDYAWIWQLSAGGALIFFFYLLLRFVIGRITDSLCRLEKTIQMIDQTMQNRDQIILNHLEHFQSNELEILRLMKRLCDAWEVNGGGRQS